MTNRLFTHHRSGSFRIIILLLLVHPSQILTQSFDPAVDGFMNDLMRGHTYTVSPADTATGDLDHLACREIIRGEAGARVVVSFDLPGSLKRSTGGTLPVTYSPLSAGNLATNVFWDPAKPAILTLNQHGVIDIALGFTVTVPENAKPGRYYADCSLTAAYAINKTGSTDSAVTGTWHIIVTVLDQQYPSPGSFTILPNYPNPFNGGTVIPFTLWTPSQVSVTIFDCAGREVSTLSAGHYDAGEYTVRWDPLLGDGNPAGIYFCRITVGTISQVQRMVLLK